MHYKESTGETYGVRTSLKCWSFIDIQSSLSSKSNTLDLVLLQKPVKLKSVKMEIKRLEDNTSIKPYGSKRNLDLNVSFKII